MNPNATLSVPSTFGQITVQFSLKYVFAGGSTRASI